MRPLDPTLTAEYYWAGFWSRHTWGERLHAWAQREPTRLAASDGNRRLGRAAYAEEVTALSDGLAALGVQRGDRVAILSENRVEYATTRLALSELGAVTVPLSVALGPADIGELVSAAGVDLVFAARGRGQRDHLSELRTVAPGVDLVGFDDPTPSSVVSYADLLERGRSQPRSGLDAVEQRPDPDQLDILSATSGTTQGRTKLVARTQNQYYSLQRQILGRHGITADDVVLGLAPMTQAVGSNPMYANLLFGAAYVELARFDPAAALETIVAERVTYLVTVPTHLVDLLDEMVRTNGDISSLRVVYSAGSAVNPDLARAIEERTGACFLSAYGAIDAGAGSGSGPTDPPEARFSTAGRIYDGELVRVTDEEGTVLPAGQVGEFRLRGPSGALGYWDDEEADRALFDDDGFARTGDLGCIDIDGYLRVLDRSKDIIIRGGQNVVPAEVERALHSHPAVRHAAVVPAPDPRLGEICCAFVVPRGAPPTLDELRRHLRQIGLASFKLPERLEVVDELPLSAGGKVRKAELRSRLS